MVNKILLFTTIALLHSFFSDAQRLPNQISVFGGKQNNAVGVGGLSYTWQSGYSENVFRFIAKTSGEFNVFNSEDKGTDTSASNSELAERKFFNVWVGGVIHTGPVFFKVLAGTGLEGQIGFQSKKFVLSSGYSNNKLWNSNRNFEGHKYIHGPNYWEVETKSFKKTKPNGDPIEPWIKRGDLDFSLTWLISGHYENGTCYEGSWGQIYTVTATYGTPVSNPFKGPGSIFVALTCTFGQ